MKFNGKPFDVMFHITLLLLERESLLPTYIHT